MHNLLGSPKARRAPLLGRLVGALLLLAAVAPGASQASQAASLKVSFAPYVLGAGTTLTFNARIGTSDGGVPSPVVSAAVSVPRGMGLDTSTLGLAVCQSNPLLSLGISGCSPNSLMGFGSALAEVPFGAQVVHESANIAILMGPPVGHHTALLLYVTSKSPVIAQLVIPGVLISEAKHPETLLPAPVPLIPTLPGSPNVSVNQLRLSIGPEHLRYEERRNGRVVGYRPVGVAIPPTCTRPGFRFEATFEFLDGSSTTATSVVPCPSHRAGRT